MNGWMRELAGGRHSLSLREPKWRLGRQAGALGALNGTPGKATQFIKTKRQLFLAARGGKFEPMEAKLEASEALESHLGVAYARNHIAYCVWMHIAHIDAAYARNHTGYCVW